MSRAQFIILLFGLVALSRLVRSTEVASSESSVNGPLIWDRTESIGDRLHEIEEKVVEVMDLIRDKQEEETQSTCGIDEDFQSLIENEEKEEKPAELKERAIVATTAELIDEAKANKFTLMSLFCGRYYERYYTKINAYLVDKLEEDDGIENNMREALNWLQSLEKATFRNENLIKALKQFTALTKIGGPHMCTRNAYEILRKNDLATKRRAHRRPSKLGALRRVDKVVYEYSLKHAIDCLPEYPKRFAEKRAQLDATKLGLVEPLFDEIFQTILRPRSLLYVFPNPKVYDRLDPTALVSDIKTLDSSEVGAVCFGALVTYSRDDPDSKYLGPVNDDRSGTIKIREDKLIALFEKYIVKPCEYYIEQLGFDVLIPMRFDVQMFDRVDRYALDSDLLRDFYMGYARFRACNLLVYQDQKALARHVVKAARKSAAI